MILILCGSVSSWIEDNILKDKGYVGQVSLQLKLEELPLHDADKFWKGNAYISAFEKLKILCVTGGVPLYLEEVNPKQTAEANIRRLCYQPEGLLFNEFDSIFRDIFGKKSNKYREICVQLASGSIDQVALSKKLKVGQSGALSRELHALESAGFIRRDFVWGFNGKSSTSKYRLSDNYLRFYLKYVEPNRDLILGHMYTIANLESPNWAVIMGLQFENLVLNNLRFIVRCLDVAAENIVSAAPYFQLQTAQQREVQVDLLIHTQYTLYVCEIKFRKHMGTELISQMAEKISRLKVPANLSVRPVLICQGELSEALLRANYFVHILYFSDLLNFKNTLQSGRK